MEQPQRVKVGPFDYKVRWYDRAEENRDGRYGYADSNELEIGISDRLLNGKKAETFIHELLHTLWDFMNLKGKVGEEELVSKFGTGLTMLARDNPEVINWWLQQAQKEET